MPDSKFGSHSGLTEVTVSLSEVLPSGLNQPSFKLILNIVPCPQFSQDVLKNFDALVHAAESTMVTEYVQSIKSGQHPDEEVSKQLALVLSTLVEASPALQETVLYMQTVASAMKMPEGVINDSVIVQLRGVKEFRDMVLDGNKKGTGIKNISRFHLSKEDFYFYHINNGRMDDLNVVQCTALDDDIDSTDDDIDSTDAFAGDSKLDAEKNINKNMRQLKANMTKTGAMCLYKAARSLKVIKTVNVIGFLADYRTRKAIKFMKIEFQLIPRQTKVNIVEVGHELD